MALTIALQPEIEARFQAEAACEGVSAEDWAARRLTVAASLFGDSDSYETEPQLSASEIAELVSALSKVETAAQELSAQVAINLRLLQRNVNQLETARLIVADSNARARVQETASLMDLAALLEKLAGTFSTIATLKRQFEEIVKTLEKQGEELDQLRKENAALTTRVAVLEEGRKTVAAEVKIALTETLAQLEINRLKEKLAEAEGNAKRQSGRSLPEANDAPNL